MTVVSEDEAAVYDRQIRLWGLEAQQRIQSSRVLVIGCRGLANETVKNLVLAGIHSVTLMDHEPVTVVDLGAQFLLTADDLGTNRAEASARRASLLNPRVIIETQTARVSELPDEYFAAFTVICMLGLDSLDDMIRVNNIAHAKGIAFYAGDAPGYFGFVFADLASHSYIEEKQVAAVKDAEPEIKREKKVETYASLSVCLEKSFKGLNGRALKRQASPLLFAFFALLEYHRTQKTHGNVDGDPSELRLLLDKVLERHAVASDFVPLEIFQSLVANAGHEFSPVCAIIGGMLAQDILKSVSAKELPISNFLVYNGFENSALIHRIEA